MRKSHVLLVDDVAKNIQIAASVLKQQDCQISFAQTGEKALEILRKNQIDLVLLDVMMPGMDGYEVCRKIKSTRKTRDIPVIFLTAKNDIESITLAFQAGGVDYISKPFNSEELLTRVRNQLDLSQALHTITEQKNKLEALNAVKDKLFSIIAHDLRNPFNGLIVSTDILKEKLERMEKEDIRRMIDVIYNSSRDGYYLLENLLEWSRAQRSEIAFKPIRVDVLKMIQGNIQLIEPQASSKHVKLEASLTELPEIMADPHMLDSIIRNLITNAIKFTPPMGHVTITGKVVKDEIWLSVKDSGLGISKKDVDKLFSSSSRLTTLGTSNERGTGLGLLLCKEFIDRHQGRIWVESELEKGSEFLISLPLTR